MYLLYTYHLIAMVAYWSEKAWRHNGRDGVSNHQPHDCLLNRLFWHWSKKTSKLRVTGLCDGNSPVTGEFPAQRTSITQKMFPFDDAIMIQLITLRPPGTHRAVHVADALIGATGTKPPGTTMMNWVYYDVTRII